MLMLLSCVIPLARNLEVEQAKPKFKPAKIRELKVLDAKSAQNICKFIKIVPPMY